MCPGHKQNKSKKEYRKKWKARHPEGRKSFAKEKRKKKFLKS
jgi:hypothetical protein